MYIRTFENDGNTAADAIDAVELDVNEFLSRLPDTAVESIRAQTMFEFYGSNQYGDPQMNYRHIVTIVMREDNVASDAPPQAATPDE